MKSQNTCNVDKGGFTLIETLVALALGATLLGSGFFITLSTMKKTSLIHERDLIVSLLLKARAEALANTDESPHGLHITPLTFVLFDGATYVATDPTNRVFPRQSVALLAGDDTVVFLPLHGNTNSEKTITLTHESNTARIVINTYGRIEW